MQHLMKLNPDSTQGPSIGLIATTKTMKVLIVERPGPGVAPVRRNDVSRQRFHLDENAAMELEHDAVMWRGSTAFIMETAMSAGGQSSIPTFAD